MSEKLIKDNVHLVRTVAGRIAARLPSGIDIEDLIGAGMLGLLSAAGQYDEARGVPFDKYAEIRIRGSILDELRNLDQTSRSARTRNEEIRSQVSDLSNRLGRAPTSEEIAAALGISVASYQEMLLQASPNVIVSMNQPLSLSDGSEGTEMGSMIGDTSSPEPDEQTINTESATILLSAVSNLTPRQRHVIKLHYLEGMNFREVSEALEITEGRTSQLHSAAMVVLKELINHDPA